MTLFVSSGLKTYAVGITCIPYCHDDMQQTHQLPITVAYHLTPALTVSMSYVLLLAKTSNTMHHTTCSLVSIWGP